MEDSGHTPVIYGPVSGHFFQAVVELLESLLVKLRIAPYARCGAGEKQHGLRAMVGAACAMMGWGWWDGNGWDSSQSVMDLTINNQDCKGDNKDSPLLQCEDRSEPILICHILVWWVSMSPDISRFHQGIRVLIPHCHTWLKVVSILFGRSWGGWWQSWGDVALLWWCGSHQPLCWLLALGNDWKPAQLRQPSGHLDSSFSKRAASRTSWEGQRGCKEHWCCTDIPTQWFLVLAQNMGALTLKVWWPGTLCIGPTQGVAMDWVPPDAPSISVLLAAIVLGITARTPLSTSTFRRQPCPWPCPWPQDGHFCASRWMPSPSKRVGTSFPEQLEALDAPRPEATRRVVGRG